MQPAHLTPPPIATEAFTDADIEFHRLIHEATGNAILLELMSSVSVLDRKTRVVLSADRAACEETIPEHAKILTALRERDPERAAAAMQRHLAKCWSYTAGAAWQRPTEA